MGGDDTVQIILILTSGVSLVITLFAEAFLHAYHYQFIPGSAVAIGLGLIVGAIIRLTHDESAIESQEFDSHIFTLLLLPVIIFQAAYSSTNFYVFLMLKPILLFACMGTLISWGIIWPCVYGAGFLPGAEAAAFAALISAVDPVATLSVFSEIKVEPKLSALVSGEAVINDAVAIVLYRASANFDSDDAHTSAFKNIGLFFLLVTVSVLVGLITGLTCALALKYGLLHKHKPVSEVIVFVAFSYASFLLAEAAQQSGIVASLICGFTMREFATPNLTARAKVVAGDALRILACASENFIFIQVGINMAFEMTDIDMGLVTLTIVLCSLCRALSTFGLSFLHNLSRTRASETFIPKSNQVVMWHAGLRGAIAFAVAFDFSNDNGNRSLVISTTCFVILFTVLVQGGTTQCVLTMSGVETGVVPDPEVVKQMEETLTKSKFRRCLNSVGRTLKPYVIRGHMADKSNPLARLRESQGDHEAVAQTPAAVAMEHAAQSPLGPMQPRSHAVDASGISLEDQRGSKE